MVTFIDLLYVLDDFGVMTVMTLFFVLFINFYALFAFVYVLLRKTHVLTKSNQAKLWGGIGALLLASCVVIPSILGYYPPGLDPVSIFNRALPQIALVVFGLNIPFSIVVIASMWFIDRAGGKTNKGEDKK